MAKSADAFRTISEVSEWLDTPAHVLRFWESKFSQVKPVKRAGGRRYYRPSDMELLGGIKRLLHEDGMTIKGAQKLLREKGVAHVAALSQPLDDVTAAVRDAMDSKALKAKQDAARAEKADEPGMIGHEPAVTVEPQAESVVFQNPDPVDADPGDATAEPAPVTTPSVASVTVEADAPANAPEGETPAATPSVADVKPFRAPPPAGPVARAATSPQAQPHAVAPPALLAAIYARKDALPAAAAAQVTALRGKLQLWLAKDLS